MRSVELRPWVAPFAATASLLIIVALYLAEIVPMTLAGILAIALLAFINAAASLDERRFGIETGEGDSKAFLRKFISTEAFWRAFVTNLSFGGVSLALAVVGFKSQWNFWDINNAILPLLVNFIMGIVAPRLLADAYEAPPPLSWGIIGAGILIYVLTALSAASFYTPTTGSPAGAKAVTSSRQAFPSETSFR